MATSEHIDSPKLSICPWYVRWWHARLRAADVAAILPIVMQSCPTLSQQVFAWTVFVEERGQEHWQCPCGHGEAAQAFLKASQPS